MDLYKHLETAHDAPSFEKYRDGEKRQVVCLTYHKQLHTTMTRDHTHANLGRVAAYVVEEVSPPTQKREASIEKS